jgi:hypothetical protein
MSDDSLRKLINAYEDEQLVEVAWNELDRWKAEETVKLHVRKDLEEAEWQLRQAVVLSPEGRNRLRRFIFNVRSHNGKRRRR